MTCRHKAGDPACSSTIPGSPAARAFLEPLVARAGFAITPEPDHYQIEEVERIGPHLAMKVRYPNCRACAFEGVKVLVYLTVSEVQVLRWRRIDPHFRPPPKSGSTQMVAEAPSPAARFPASPEGWADALAYARSKVRP